jgi:hypothetical protein
MVDDGNQHVAQHALLLGLTAPTEQRPHLRVLLEQNLVEALRDFGLSLDDE